MGYKRGYHLPGSRTQHAAVQWCQTFKKEMFSSFLNQEEKLLFGDWLHNIKFWDGF